MSSISTTPGFAWSQPSAEKATGTNEDSAEFANPILKSGGRPVQMVMASSEASRTPFSPIANTSNLRRRKPSLQKTADLPPKLSLADGGFQPILNEEDKAGAVETTKTLGMITDTSEDDSHRWILVSGFTSRTHTDEILRRYDGSTVTAQKFGRSNWLALRFDTALHAEKALCLPLFSLRDGTIISVHRLSLEDGQTKKDLDWSNATASFPGFESKTVRGSRAAFSRGRNELTEDDIFVSYDPEGDERQSVCRKLLGLIFGWD